MVCWSTWTSWSEAVRSCMRQSSLSYVGRGSLANRWARRECIDDTLACSAPCDSTRTAWNHWSPSVLSGCRERLPHDTPAMKSRVWMGTTRRRINYNMAEVAYATGTALWGAPRFGGPRALGGPALWGAPRCADFCLLAVSRGVYMQVV